MDSGLPPLASREQGEDTRVPTLRTSDDCDLYFSDWGDPSGLPVVLVHAWGLSGQMWSQQLPAMIDAGLRCVVYDRRGHGRSDQPGSGYDLSTLADDLAGVIARLGLHDAVVVGHSMGASELVRYLTRHGTARVAGIVLSAPTLPAIMRTEDNPGGVDRAIFEEARRAMRADIGAWMARTSNKEYFGPGWPMAEDLGVWTRQQIASTPCRCSSPASAASSTPTSDGTWRPSTCRHWSSRETPTRPVLLN